MRPRWNLNSVYWAFTELLIDCPIGFESRNDSDSEYGKLNNLNELLNKRFWKCQLFRQNFSFGRVFLSLNIKGARHKSAVTRLRIPCINEKNWLIETCFIGSYRVHKIRIFREGEADFNALIRIWWKLPYRIFKKFTFRCTLVLNLHESLKTIILIEFFKQLVPINFMNCF